MSKTDPKRIVYLGVGGYFEHDGSNNLQCDQSENLPGLRPQSMAPGILVSAGKQKTAPGFLSQ